MCLKESDDGYKRGFKGEGRKEGMAMLYYSISYFLSKKRNKKIQCASCCVLCGQANRQRTQSVFSSHGISVLDYLHEIKAHFLFNYILNSKGKHQVDTIKIVITWNN